MFCKVTNLVNIEFFNDLIKHRVKIIKHVYNFHRFAAMTDRCESNNVTEEDRYTFEGLGENILPSDSDILKAKLSTRQTTFIGIQTNCECKINCSTLKRM